MCTLSWIQRPDGYSVFMNRDEQPGRAPGIPPGTGGTAVRWLAPRDGQNGGTWIGVNERGLSLAILNRYHESPVGGDGPWTSRGLLVLSLLESATKDEVERGLRAMSLPEYQPFTLASFEVGRGARLLSWNGRDVTVDDVVETGLVATSSGFDQELATSLRGGLFQRWQDFDPEPSPPSQPSEASFEAIHRSHIPERGPLSVCMHRPEAGTVSFTRISVSPGRTEMVYVPGPPCTTTERIVTQESWSAGVLKC